MPEFYGISPGEEKTAPGLRVRVSEDGSRVYMSGKWLDLGDDHAVAYVERDAYFERPDGRRLHAGQFPAWVAASRRKAGQKKPAPFAMMFNIAQFRGGKVVVS
jgi:hypothetical protein